MNGTCLGRLADLMPAEIIIAQGGDFARLQAQKTRLGGRVNFNGDLKHFLGGNPFQTVPVLELCLLKIWL